MTCVTPTTLDVTPSALRSQLARWPTGVAVVTALGPDGPVGKTVNSFHATSLEPALVGWCIDHRSSQLEAWLAAEGYVVHVAAADQTDLVTRFATSAADQTDLVTRFATSAADRFAGLAWRPGVDGMPILPVDVPLRLECRVAHRFAVGDHTYLIGEVVAMTAAADVVPMTLQR